jgi:hypothetical protein
VDASSSTAQDMVELAQMGRVVRFYPAPFLVPQEDKVLHVHATTGTTLRTLTEAGNKVNVVEFRGDAEVGATI